MNKDALLQKLPPGLYGGLRTAGYEIRGVLGVGGMGMVLDAVQERIGRPVAIKVLRQLTPDPDEWAEANARFEHEATTQGRLSHPGIVHIYDFGGIDDAAWIAMERIDGGSLENTLEHGNGLTLPEILSLMGEVLDALAHAHAGGVVHRDVKPGNILLTKDGRVKLCDFGIAWVEQGTRFSRTGTMVGAPSYMAPEQFKGEAPDARTDVWAAGVLLYRLLTGILPFTGSSVTAMMRQVLDVEPPRPTSLPGLASPAMSAVVMRAMAKRPENRFATARDFAAAITQAAKAAGTENVTVVLPAPGGQGRRGISSRRNQVFWGLGAAGMVVAAGVTMLLRPPTPEKPLVTIVVPPLTPPEDMATDPLKQPDVPTADRGEGLTPVAPPPPVAMPGPAQGASIAPPDKPPIASPVPTAVPGRDGWLLTRDGTCSVWIKAYERGTTASWSGACSDGKATGPGTLEWTVPGSSDRSRVINRFNGPLKAGKPDGKGSLTVTFVAFEGGKPKPYDHSTYDGDFRDGEQSGTGVLRWTPPSGKQFTYRGQFKGGQFNGRGTQTSNSGDESGPTWRNGNLHGQVVYRFSGALNIEYVGGMVDGIREGRGTLVTKSDGVVRQRYEGVFRDGILIEGTARHGPQECGISGSFSFRGDKPFRQNSLIAVPLGAERRFYPNGTVLEATWIRDGDSSVAHGPGTLISPDGSRTPVNVVQNEFTVGNKRFNAGLFTCPST